MNDNIYQFRILCDTVNFYLPNPNDDIQSSIIKNKTFYEYEMLKDIFESLLPGDVIIDVGANIGNHSLFIAKFCNPEQIYSFEPFQYSFNLLKKNIEINHFENKITPIPYAVGSKPTKGAMLIRDENNIGMTQFIETNDGDIEAITLDEYFGDNLQRLDLIKIDVEGMDLEVLKGAKNLLNKYHPKIYIECLDKSSYMNVSNFLSQFGYYLKGTFNGSTTFSFVYNFKEAQKNYQKKISFFAGDSNHFHFLDPIIQYLRFNGYAVQKYLWEGNNPARMLSILRSSDLAWLEWGNDPIVEASNLPKFCPIINRIHGYEIYQDDRMKINWDNVDELILIFKSSFFLSEFKKYADPNIEQKTNINIIPNPINSLIKFYERQKGYKIAFISRTHQDKNPLLMVDILEKLVSINRNYKIFMIGGIQDSELYLEVLEKIRQKGLTDNFVYDGIINNIEDWLIDKSYILCTSKLETQGVGIMEAMMSGIKPVLYDGSGLDIYPEKYRFNTIDEAVSMILTDDYNSYEYREFVEKNYSSRVILPKIGELIKKTINRQRKHFDYEPLISICIISYNRANLLMRSIKSALAQSYEKFEVVVVDDGSTDNTEEVIKSFNSPKIRYIRKEHSGIAATRNHALREAKGEYIIWVDSDDEVSPYLLEKYIEAVNNYPDADVFYCNLLIINQEKNEIVPLRYYDWYKNEMNALYYSIIAGSPIPDPSTLIKKSIFNEIGTFNETFSRAQDFEFYSRLILSKKFHFKFINQFGYIYYIHDDNNTGIITSQTDQSYEREVLRNILQNADLQEIFYMFDWENNFQWSLAQAFYLLAQGFANYQSIKNTLFFFKENYKLTRNPDILQKIKALEDGLNQQIGVIKQIANVDINQLDDKTKKNIQLIKGIVDENEVNLDFNKLLEIENIGKENENIINAVIKDNNRILFICDNYLPSIGGVELVVKDLALGLKSRGYSIDIACKWFPTRDSDEYEGMRILNFNANDNINNKKNLQEMHRLAHLIENAPYKAIIILSQPDNWIGYSVRLLKHTNNNIIYMPSIRKDLINSWKISSDTSNIIADLSKAKTLISVSENGYDKKFMDEYNLHNVFIPHSINPIATEFDFKKKYNLIRKHLLLCVANFWPIKNQSNLIKSFINEPGDFDIVIIGNKILGKEEFFDYCTELARYDDRITIIPGLSPEEVNQAIKEADLLLIPSLGESAGPLVLLQAMHYKTPWIATPYCNAAPDEAGGIIAELKDFPKYARILLDNPHLAIELGELGYQHQQRSFVLEKSIDAFVSLIEGKNNIPDFRMPDDIRDKQKMLNKEVEKLSNYHKYQSEQYIFSIIIPTYNRDDVIGMCLDAINQQTFPHDKFEVIVIDDGSTDNTEKIIKNFKNTFKLTYIKQKNSGPGAARNKGILLAKGEYALILNDDAIMDPHNLEEHYNAHKAKYNNTKAAVLGTFDFSPKFTKRSFVWLIQNSNLVFAYKLLEPNKPFDYKYFWTCNISLKTSALIESGLFDESIPYPTMEDTELGYRLQRMGFYVYFEPNAKSIHYHWLDIPGFVKRQQMNGRNIIKFISKFPETLITEGAVFGFNSLNSNEIAKLRIKRDYLTDTATELTKKLTNIDNNLEIDPNNAYLILPDNSVFDKEEFKKQIYNAARIILEYNYLTGILEQLEKQNYKLIYERKPISGPESIIELCTKYPEVEYENQNIQEGADNVDYLSILQPDYKPSFITSEQPEKITNSNKPLKILFTMYGWDESGGGTQLPRSIAMELSKSGFDVAVFYAAGKHPSNNNPYYLEEKNINNIHLYGIYNRPTVFLDEANPRREIRDDQIVELFNYVLDKEQPDIVHFHNFLGLSFAIAEAAKLRNIPTLFTPHNYHLIDPELYMFDMENKFKKWKNIDFFENSNLPKKYPNLITDYKIRRQSARNIIANQIDYVLAISQREAGILAEYSENSGNIYVINQVSQICNDLAKSNLKHPCHSPLRIGFIGSILIHKGIHIIYQAAEMLKNEPVEFYLYGIGSPDLINALNKSFPNSKVVYKGAYSENDLFHISKEIDAVIIPSIWEEGGPLTAPESIAMGLPIIGANIGGIPDFVQDGVNGMLYQYDNPANLANRIQEIIDNPQILDKFKENLQLNITFQDYISHISTIYQNIANKIPMNRHDIELRFHSHSKKLQPTVKEENYKEINQISDNSNSFNEQYVEIEDPVGNNISNTIIYKPLMLHLGSQGVVLDGFDNLDAQPQSSKEIQCDVRQLPYPNESADIVLAIDLLQVYSHRETDSVLKEWARVIKKGGTLILSVPDLKKILNDYYNNNLPISEANQYIFGKQANDYDYHYNGFDDVSLQKHLQTAGLQIVELQHQANSMPRLIARAVKI